MCISIEKRTSYYTCAPYYCIAMMRYLFLRMILLKTRSKIVQNIKNQKIRICFSSICLFIYRSGLNDLHFSSISQLLTPNSSIMFISSLRERLVSAAISSRLSTISSLTRTENTLYPSSPLTFDLLVILSFFP